MPVGLSVIVDDTMQFKLRTLFIFVGLITFVVSFSIAWLRRPIVGRMIGGQRFELSGFDALLHCVMNNDAVSLNRLLTMDRYKMEWTSRDGDWTLLQLALQHGCVATTRVLLEHDADPNFFQKGTPSPLELARRSGNPELTLLLTRYGAVEP